MKSSHHRVNNAKAVVALLILAIAFVLFWKFNSSSADFMNDPEALRSYVVAAIGVGGFLIGLLYLTSKTEHKEPAKVKPKAAGKSVKSSKTTKKKKK